MARLRRQNQTQKRPIISDRSEFFNLVTLSEDKRLVQALHAKVAIENHVPLKQHSKLLQKLVENLKNNDMT